MTNSAAAAAAERPSVDTVRDPDGAKSTARHEQSWMAREARFESRDSFGVSDIVLRACVPPAMDQREQGSTRNAEHGGELACHDAGEVIVREIDG